MPEWSKGSRLGRDTKVRGFKPHSAHLFDSSIVVSISACHAEDRGSIPRYRISSLRSTVVVAFA